jgi:DNA-binding NarL/FixJ family response regulator
VITIALEEGRGVGNVKKVSIIVADDHALVRAGIRALMERIPGVEVVGEAGYGNEALELIEKVRPDIAILDLAMPKMTGFEAAEVITQRFPEVKVIVLTMYHSPESVMHALRAGAHGYIVKDAAKGELAAAIDAVMRGEVYLSPAISRTIAARSLEGTDQPGPAEELTPRQRQVPRLLVEGNSMKEIAHTLEVSIKTVEAHRTQQMNRLRIYDIPGLVRYAMRTGLTAPEPPWAY